MADWTDLKSSNIRRARYDPATRRMEIEFHTGAHHAYDEIDPLEYDEFTKADSAGRFFQAHFRGRKSENLANRDKDKGKNPNTTAGGKADYKGAPKPSTKFY